MNFCPECISFWDRIFFRFHFFSKFLQELLLYDYSVWNCMCVTIFCIIYCNVLPHSIIYSLSHRVPKNWVIRRINSSINLCRYLEQKCRPSFLKTDYTTQIPTFFLSAITHMIAVGWNEVLCRSWKNEKKNFRKNTQDKSLSENFLQKNSKNCFIN